MVKLQNFLNAPRSVHSPTRPDSVHSDFGAFTYLLTYLCLIHNADADATQWLSNWVASPVCIEFTTSSRRICSRNWKLNLLRMYPIEFLQSWKLGHDCPSCPTQLNSTQHVQFSIFSTKSVGSRHKLYTRSCEFKTATITAHSCDGWGLPDTSATGHFGPARDTSAPVRRTLWHQIQERRNLASSKCRNSAEAWRLALESILYRIPVNITNLSNV